MAPDSAKEALIAWLTAKGLNAQYLAPGDGVSEMLNFFCNVRPEGCASTDGDMLLFQWGTYDWGSGPRFEVDITRQFIALHREGDDAISQLHLTYRFAPTSFLHGQGSGNRWCKTPADIASFDEYLAGHPALHAVLGVDPVEVALSYEYV